jgi:hypothetical protein
MENTQYREFKLAMRSNTTFKTDSETIRVWEGQDEQEVAQRIAEGYGATVEELVAL